MQFSDLRNKRQIIVNVNFWPVAFDEELHTGDENAARRTNSGPSVVFMMSKTEDHILSVSKHCLFIYYVAQKDKNNYVNL